MAHLSGRQNIPDNKRMQAANRFLSDFSTLAQESPINVSQHRGIVEHFLPIAGMRQDIAPRQQIGYLLQRQRIAFDAGRVMGAARNGIAAQIRLPAGHNRVRAKMRSRATSIRAIISMSKSVR